MAQSLGYLGFVSLCIAACSESEPDIDQEQGITGGANSEQLQPSSRSPATAERFDAPDIAPAPATGMPSGVLIEDLRIDGVAEDLVAIGDVAVSADGTIAFVQQQDSGILFYDEAGNRIGTFGRPGDGPGEFRGLSGIGWFGDTLWADDFRQNRLTLISQSLQLLGTYPTAVGGRTPVLGVSANGWYVGRIFQASQVSSVIGRIELDRSAWTTLMTLPPEEDARIRFSGGFVSLPFGNLPESATADNGERVAIAMATRDGPDAETFLLTVVSSQGDTVFSRRYPFEGEPIPRDVGERLIEDRIALVQGSQGGSGFESAIADMRSARVPPFYAPLRRLLVGNDLSIWVELRMSGDQLPYFVVDPRGTPVGSVVIPPRSRIVAATLTTVWLVTADDLGIESLIRHSVRWK